jgi:hypothetical protein
MPDKLQIIDPKKKELGDLIEKIPWGKYGFWYGTVEVQIRNGKVGLIAYKETDKRD